MAAVHFDYEADFRVWFEANLAAFGVKRIILSQEPCPDYVVEMQDGRILRVEAELFAINFKYHRHDPAKVDYILACYSKSDTVADIPVWAVNRLHVWEAEVDDPLPPETPLNEVEFAFLSLLIVAGNRSLAAFSDTIFEGDQQLWIRFSPDAIAAMPRGRDDSLFTVMSPDTKDFVRRTHHALIGAGLSTEACDAIEGLQRRQLVDLRPLAFLAALWDGGMINHRAWLPTEIRANDTARRFYRSKVGLFPGRDRRSTEQT